MAQTSAPSRNPLSLDQVERILRTRKMVTAEHIGSPIDDLRIVGKGNPTKDGKRVVYNTNAMRRNAVPAAKAHLRAAKLALSMGDSDAAQTALQMALNEGVITFSLDSSWTQFPAGANLTARVESFVIQEGPDAGQTGIGIGSVRLVPTVSLKSDADCWNDDEDETSHVPAAEIAEASQLG